MIHVAAIIFFYQFYQPMCISQLIDIHVILTIKVYKYLIKIQLIQKYFHINIIFEIYIILL